MTPHAAQGGDIIMVPVPRDYLADVYRTLAAVMPKPGVGIESRSANDEPGPDEEVDPSGWTRADIARLRSLIRTPTPRAVLDLVTASPGTPVTFEEACVAAKQSTHQGRSQMGGFSKLVRLRFDDRPWPFAVEWLPGGRASYVCTSPTVATWWRESGDQPASDA